MKQFNHICAIGDSHVGIFSPYCRLCTLGPATMYSLTTSKLQEYITYLLSRNEIDKHSWWIFSVGEIDIRCLFHKQIYTYNRQEDDVIETLVDDYISNIQSLNHPQTILCTIIAPAKTEGFEAQQQHTINSQYPFIGSDTDRNRWTLKTNTYLKAMCHNKNIHYIDIYTLFKNSDGFLDHQYIDADMIHVAKNDKIVDILHNFN